MRIEYESLLSGGRRRKTPALYQWLDRESLEELITAYYRHASDTQRPCGFVCAESRALVRTAVSDMESYCKKVRACQKGKDVCRLSDYAGSAIAMRRGEPVLYSCGSLAYDFAIPLKDSKGKVVGAFIDGQLRPRIPLLVNNGSLGAEGCTDDESEEAYKSLPVLDRRRARMIRDYVSGQFADLLQYHNRRSRSADLDVDAFRIDTGFLGQMLLEAAANGLVKQMCELTPEVEDFSGHFLAAPLVEHRTIVGEKRHSFDTLEVGVRHPTERQLRCHFSAWTGKDGAFRDYCERLKEPRVISPAEDGVVKQLLEQFNRSCYEPQGKYKSGLYWLVVPVQNHTQVGVLSVAAFHRKQVERLERPLCEWAHEAGGYLDRYELAGLLTRACGEPMRDGVGAAERKECFASVRSRLGRLLTETDPTVPLEWQPLLEDLAYALDRIEDPNTLTSSDRRVFDETVVATLGSPYFLPIEELRASHSLRSISGLAAGAAEREGRVRRETRVIFERATDFGERKKLINEGLRWFEEHGGNLGF